MSKLEALRSEFQKDGTVGTLKLLWMHLVLRQPLSLPVDDIILHKIALSPQVGYWPKIKAPRSFNEKVMHRKLLTDEDLYSTVADKYSVREYVRERVGSEVLTEVYTITDDPETIQFEKLPEEFVIKPNHASGLVYFVDDKENEDFESIKSLCDEWLSTSFGDVNGEYWYTEIDPKIMIEERLRDENGGTPPDFKFFVFHGQVECIQVDHDRFTGHTRRLYEPDWTPMDVSYEYPIGPEIEEPTQLDRMITVAETLGEGFEFVRVDLYHPEGDSIIFGEMTLAPETGGGRFCPKEYDFELGSYW